MARLEYVVWASSPAGLAAVAVAPQVRRHDREAVGQSVRDPPPDAAGLRVAVQQKQRRARTDHPRGDLHFAHVDEQAAAPQSRGRTISGNGCRYSLAAFSLHIIRISFAGMSPQ